MGLNIKNQHVHDLARAAAEVTGKSQTGAIEEALERLLEAYGADPQAARAQRKLDMVQEILVDYRRDPGRTTPEIRAIEDLYDDATGLPR
jgi:antitoxin VapB